jgi:hypothetical protein
MTKPSYREYHGITVDPDELQSWVLANGDLGTHDGDCDYLSLFCGAYQEWIPDSEAD